VIKDMKETPTPGHLHYPCETVSVSIDQKSTDVIYFTRKFLQILVEGMYVDCMLKCTDIY